uniref:RING-type E3 ubiquitin transferase n=1 Tax=Oryza brachyantha TaxID=4533 RepID=J3M0W4_ORYBR
MASSAPTWVPYEPTRDCSQGLCSMYCPQWCYFIFPPPPPFDVAGTSASADDSTGPVFSPLVIAIIGVLASAFLLVSYYTFISKYCGSFSSLWGRLFGSSSGGAAHGRRAGGGSGRGQSRSHESWDVSPPSGLDETLINKITVCKYRRGDGFVHSTDCSVCLGEFRDGESLRLLPSCSHAFHQQCIDTWLKSHSNCPLCRANITFVTVEVAASPEPEGCASVGETGGNTHEVVVVMDGLENLCEEQQEAVSGVSTTGDDHGVKDIAEGMEEANAAAEIREEVSPPTKKGSSSSDLHHDNRMCIADVLQESMEDELTAARESGLLSGGAGTSRRCHGENSKERGRSRRALQLQDAMDSLPGKRLPSGGRSCFSSKSGRGKDSDHPM